MAKRRGKASKGIEQPSNSSISNKGVKKIIKKKRKPKKTNETSNSKVVHFASRRDLVGAPTYASVSPSIPLANDQEKQKEKEGRNHASGFIFMCNGRTKPECYEYRVFGLPKGKIDVVKNINQNTKLFLFDTDAKLLYGIYQATSKGALDLEPMAFNGKFQAQVKFKIFKECLPLPESAFRRAIKGNYEGGRKFRQELSSTQVKSLVSLFRPIAKKPSTKKAHVCSNVAIQPSFRPTRTKEVVKSYPPENSLSGVHYLPILETRSQHAVRHEQYNPFEPGLHVSHSQVQPRLVRVDAPPRHVEPYHPEQAHEAYFPERSFIIHPHGSHESIRNTVETNLGGHQFVYGRQYTSQLLMDQDVPRVDYTPSYYSRRLSPTTSHIPLSQAGPSANYSQNRLPSPYHSQNRLPSPYHSQNRLPSPYHMQNRLPLPYHMQNRLPSPYHSQNRLPSPHRSYYSAVASHDRGRGYVDVSLPQGGPGSGKVGYGDANLSISSYYS